MACSSSTGTSQSNTSAARTRRRRRIASSSFIDPVVWADIGDRDLRQAVVHSHLSSPPRPSRTDVENIGQWEGQPYLIYSLREDALAAWSIAGGEISALDVT